MPKSKYETFPACCQKVLDVLDHDQRSGARNCEKGHLVSIEYARSLMVEQAAKAAREAAAAKAAAAAAPEAPASKEPAAE
jgi:hypothetical protein